MTPPNPTRQSLLESTPDNPLWSATRYLLHDGGRITADNTGVIVANKDADFLSVIGAPADDTIAGALSHATHDAEILVQCEFASQFRKATGLPGKHANLYILENAAPVLARNPQINVRMLDAVPADLPDPNLHEELTDVVESAVPISAAYVEDDPVAFCYAVCESEGYWEVSIDTLSDHRRNGYAIQAFLHHYQTEKDQGRDPIWGAFKDNTASNNLAQRLGFKHTAEIWEFTRNTSV